MTFGKRRALSRNRTCYTKQRSSFCQSEVYKAYTRHCIAGNEAVRSPLCNRLSATCAFLLSGPVLARLALAPIHSHFIVCNTEEKRGSNEQPGNWTKRELKLEEASQDVFRSSGSSRRVGSIQFGSILDDIIGSQPVCQAFLLGSTARRLSAVGSNE